MRQLLLLQVQTQIDFILLVKKVISRIMLEDL